MSNSSTCPKHPHQKMVLIFNFYVCDICEPPRFKEVVKPAEKPSILSFSRIDEKLYLLCQVCGRRCRSMINNKLFCSKKHVTPVGQLEVWDRLECSQGGARDMFYDGFSWIYVP